jgi:hypothetical protein
MDYLGLALTPLRIRWTKSFTSIARQSASRKETATFWHPSFQSGTGPKKNAGRLVLLVFSFQSWTDQMLDSLEFQNFKTLAELKPNHTIPYHFQANLIL